LGATEKLTVPRAPTFDVEVTVTQLAKLWMVGVHALIEVV
jgi:hypothetical protein